LGQAKVLGTGQNEPTWIRACVNIALQVAEQFRNVLDLINDRAITILCQKSPWIAKCILACVQASKTPKGKKNNWLQTIPGRSWIAVLRMYGPEEPWIEQTWRPGEIELME
jgi:hypothetical protein